MKHKISLWMAILINVNIVIGAGFFLIAPRINQTAGMLSPLSWLLVGLALFPLALVLSKLSKIYPDAGGIFVYSDKALGSLLGFISGWGYFIGTAAGNAVLLQEFGSQLQVFGYTIPFVNKLTINLLFTGFFMVLCCMDIKILGRFQIGITILKTVPLLLIVGSAFLLFSSTNISTAPISVNGLIKGIPLALFSYIGIEVCTSIAHTIKDAQRNAARAILLSFVAIVTIYTVIQFLLLSIHGIHSNNPFVDTLPLITSNPHIILWGTKLINFALLASYLGGFYGMFYANNWVLYAIAKENRIIGSKHLVKINKHHAPWVSVIAQALVLVVCFVITTNSNNLIIMSSFGVVIPYILTAIAFIILAKKHNMKTSSGFLAIIGSGGLLYFCFEELLELGVQYSIPFIAVLLIGIGAYWIHTKRLKHA